MSDKFTESCRGAPCRIGIPSVCQGLSPTVIPAHSPSEWKGMAKKSPNFCVVACCAGCHDVLDRRTKYPLTGEVIKEDEAAWYWLRGMQRQVKAWLDEGVLHG